MRGPAGAGVVGKGKGKGKGGKGFEKPKTQAQLDKEMDSFFIKAPPKQKKMAPKALMSGADRLVSLDNEMDDYFKKTEETAAEE